ncbi:class I SAM-dependent methyltransferase [Bifidobacterium gallicum]|nr:class I SAM-dependent methyltransferase [Bifidobacterium gallicum]EFA22359.1 hypothetical protein BIFGAL_04120 [Bifidobacterium gallicum DSM 20093 = LMG 11596]
MPDELSGMASAATREFVDQHRGDDVRELALHAKRTDDVDMPFALNQIAGWQTARTKLPEWAAHHEIIYPPHLSMEQCSSQFTAHVKMRLAQRVLQEAGIQPQRFADLTGGFGVDCSYLARLFTDADYVEQQPHLCTIAQHNYAALALTQVHVHQADARKYLESINGEGTAKPYDLIYLDPARRDGHGARTVAIEDCTPNVLEMKDGLLRAAHAVMIKLSPMLDWRQAVEQFEGSVSHVVIVSAGNECKELLLVLQERDDAADCTMLAINDDQQLEYVLGHESQARLNGWNGEPGNGESSAGSGLQLTVEALEELAERGELYMYEPNASIMKAGAFDVLEQLMPVTQVGPHSHLFVGTQLIDQFPGRKFQVTSLGTMNKQSLKTQLQRLRERQQGEGRKTLQANVAVRNFPLTVQQLRKKLKLSDGGSDYLFATTLGRDTHTLFWCRKAA